MSGSVVEVLEQVGIQPSAQRVAVADYVLGTEEHPSAEQVWARVKERFPMLSRATVYNTLNLFVEKGLLRELVLAEGKVVFDPKLTPHHHFIDDDTQNIVDIPWDALQVKQVDTLRGFDVREYQVVLRGRRAGVGRRQR
jgi:Fe2+ or Zn2+ uptake regulation protein